MQANAAPRSESTLSVKVHAWGAETSFMTLAQVTPVLPLVPTPPTAPALLQGCVHQTHVDKVVRVLLLVLRGAIFSTLCSWPILLCFNAGDIFFGVSAANQSRSSFTVALLMWSKLLNWVCVCTSHTALVISQVSRKTAKKPPSTFFSCWRQVIRETLPLCLVSSAVLFVVGVGLSNVKQEVRVYRLEFYAAICFFHVDTTASSLASTRFFFEQIGAPAAQRKRRYWRRHCCEFFRMMWNAGVYAVVAVFTHATFSLTLSTQTHALLFTAGSLALKTMMQEVAKHQVFKLKLKSSGVMAALVGIPTILIDTQMRITLLRARSTKTTLQGTFAMAATEILLRFAKSLWVTRQIRRRRDGLSDHRSRRESALMISNVNVIPAPSPSSIPDATVSNSYVEFLRWRSRLLHYHAAEIYVDMIAEYMALGCSYTIMYMYWDHPKYLLRAQAAASAEVGDGEGTVLPNFKPVVFAIQLSLEIVVDYIACTLEMWSGIDFTPLQRHNFFISVFLVWAVAGNIIMASNLLIRE